MPLMKFDQGYFLFSIVCKLNLAMGKLCIFHRKWLSDEKLSWFKEFKGNKQKQEKIRGQRGTIRALAGILDFIY